MTSADHPALRMENPKLWWPNGYGEAYLHDVELRFVSQSGAVGDVLKFQAGLRQMTAAGEGRRGSAADFVAYEVVNGPRTTQVSRRTMND